MTLHSLKAHWKKLLGVWETLVSKLVQTLRSFTSREILKKHLHIAFKSISHSKVVRTCSVFYLTFYVGALPIVEYVFLMLVLWTCGNGFDSATVYRTRLGNEKKKLRTNKE